MLVKRQVDSQAISGLRSAEVGVAGRHVEVRYLPIAMSKTVVGRLGVWALVWVSQGGELVPCYAR